MRWLSRHTTALVVIALVFLGWGSLWLVYDYRSPVSQWIRGFGTVQIEGWSAFDLDMKCDRFEPAHPVKAPGTTADAASQTALKAYPGAYAREVLLVSYHDTCNGGQPKVAWMVSIAWPASPADILQTGPQPRAIVVVDAATGNVVSDHNDRAPAVSPSPSPT